MENSRKKVYSWNWWWFYVIEAYATFLGLYQARTRKVHFCVCTKPGLGKYIFVSVPSQDLKCTFLCLYQARTWNVHFCVCTKPGLEMYIFVSVPSQDLESTILCLYQARTWISNSVCSGLFLIQWIEMRGSCLLCWYW